MGNRALENRIKQLKELEEQAKTIESQVETLKAEIKAKYLYEGERYVARYVLEDRKTYQIIKYYKA